VHAHPSVYTHGMFLFEVDMVSWPNEVFQGYVIRENLYES